MPKPARLTLRNAFPCPHCKSTNTRVPDSWLFQTYALRKRSCADCGTVFGTAEYVVDPAHDQPRMEELNQRFEPTVHTRQPFYGTPVQPKPFVQSLQPSDDTTEQPDYSSMTEEELCQRFPNWDR